MNEQQEFFQLLKYSNELKKNNKFLFHEDFETFQLLLRFLVTIENNFQYAEKQEYIELAKEFLDDQITADDFSYSFMALYEGISRKLGPLKEAEALELANFLKPNRRELGELFADIYGSCDSFSLDPEIAMSDERELNKGAQSLLVELQEK